MAYKKRGFRTIDVTLPNGEPRRVIEEPDLESTTAYQYTPKRMNGDGYGVTCESLERAIQWMFTTDCNHKFIKNTKVSTNPRITLFPYVCSICDTGSFSEN